MFTISFALALPLSLAGLPLVFSIFFAPIFFTLFKYTKIYQQLELPTTIKHTMQLAICIVILWFAARIFAATIPGGGAVYMVINYGKYTILPAVVLLLLLDIIVIFKSYGKKIGFTVLAVIFIVAAIKTGVPYLDKLSHEAQWQEYCETATDEFSLSGEHIEKLEFYNFISNRIFTRQEDGQLKTTGREYFGPVLLQRGVINEYEAITKGNPKHYRSILENGNEVITPINESTATHRVSCERKKYSEGPGSSRWINKQVIIIRNLKSGKVVAKRVQFIDPFMGNRSCAQIYNNQISITDFIERTIQISEKINKANN
jgi:hypothetical protein